MASTEEGEGALLSSGWDGGMEREGENCCLLWGRGEDPLSPLPATVSDPFGRRRRMGDEEEAG